MPVTWKEALIVPITKPKKLPSELDSYRPIYLLSRVGKLIERMVLRRLQWFVEEERCLPDEITSFRQGYCTVDSIMDMVSFIKHNKSRGLHTLDVFPDVESAFDALPLTLSRGG